MITRATSSASPLGLSGRLGPLAAAALAAAALAAACTNPVDTTANKLPLASDHDAAGEVADVDPAATCDCLAVGQWYRFDALTLLSIDGEDHPVLPTLNGLWASDIAGNELNIMLEVMAVSPTEVTMKVVNGARIDGTQDICELADTAVTLVFPRNGCHLGPSAESSFNVYAGTETFPKNCTTTLPVKHAIPVARAQLDGTLSGTCDAIVNGTVPHGGLGQTELGKICTCLLLPGQAAEECGALDASYTEVAACTGCNKNYHSLSDLLTAFGDVKWSCTTESGDPAACLTADFTAAALATSPAPCGE
ncbi:MAG: hypothetical protein U1F43_33700 [Myxococcota bacterium]